MSLPQAVNQITDALQVPDWLADIRRQAAQGLADVGLPGRKDENWKYTPAAEALRRSTSMDTHPQDDNDELELPELLELDQAWSLVLVDGQLDPDLTDLDDLPEGVQLLSLAEAIGQGCDWLAERWWQPEACADQGFSLLNSVWAGQGLVLRVSADTQLQRPIRLLTIDSGSTRGQLLSLRNLIWLEQGASATLIEEHRASDDASSFANVLTQLHLEQGARLDHTRISRLADASRQVNRCHAWLGTDAHLYHRAFDLGGALLRNDLSVELQQSGASLVMDGLYLLDGKQHVDNHTRVDHCVGETHSEQIYRGIIGGRGHGVFNGKAVVHKGADGTEAHQNNANLLLSRGGEIDTKPELEIYAEDVQCSHGATVGQLDATALFYLRSRGLAQDQARRLLMEAFAWTLIERLPEGPLRDHLQQEVAGVLHSLTGDQVS